VIRYTVLAALVLGVGLLTWRLVSRNSVPTASVTVKEPNLSQLAAKGKAALDANCAACHGRNAAGTGTGPPLVHDIYNPGHHADAAFFFAAKYGVRAHHWPFGNMPPQPQVNDEQLKGIVQYVRELQVANGIQSHPHTMELRLVR
jgi:mono/diheme cytochrome c family protein